VLAPIRGTSKARTCEVFTSAALTSEIREDERRRREDGHGVARAIAREIGQVRGEPTRVVGR
jgi:hypothetical protein